MSGGDRCMFLNCKNTRKTSKTVFHSIPSANHDISREWIINSGNQFLIFIKLKYSLKYNIMLYLFILKV